jgi:cell division protein FtsZ
MKKNQSKIVIAALGGGGIKIVNSVIAGGVGDMKTMALDTDEESLRSSNAEVRFHLGGKLVAGLHSGMNPVVGLAAALESQNELVEMFKGMDIVIIVAALSGGAGTGAAPAIAQFAKEAGAFVIAVVTEPFIWEGCKRKKVPNGWVDKLEDECDMSLVIANQDLESLTDRQMDLQGIFEFVDEFVGQIIKDILKLIKTRDGTASVKRLKRHAGKALFGVGVAQGVDSAYDAMLSSVKSSLKTYMPLKKAAGLSIRFYVHPDFSYMDLMKAKAFIDDNTTDTEVVIDLTEDARIPINKAVVVLIVTGYKGEFLSIRKMVFYSEVDIDCLLDDLLE